METTASHIFTVSTLCSLSSVSSIFHAPRSLPPPLFAFSFDSNRLFAQSSSTSLILVPFTQQETAASGGTTPGESVIEAINVVGVFVLQCTNGDGDRYSSFRHVPSPQSTIMEREDKISKRNNCHLMTKKALGLIVREQNRFGLATRGGLWTAPTRSLELLIWEIKDQFDPVETAGVKIKLAVNFLEQKT